jgi:hypothetical protein
MGLVIVYVVSRMEVFCVRHLKVIIFAALVGALVWGCIEDLEPSYNRKPMVWFDRGPANESVVFDNSVFFEWNAADWDDDLGMGATYVRLEPPVVDWYDNAQEESVTFWHPQGWVRVYEETYEILDLPDSTFTFSVRVEDGRGADSTISRLFYVRYDPQAPIIDSVYALEGRLDNPIQEHEYVIFAHDEARAPRGRTPPESLQYSWRFVRPFPLPALEPAAEWSRYNNKVTLNIDGQSAPGEYRFRCKVRDMAGNVSPEQVYKCEYIRP